MLLHYISGKKVGGEGGGGESQGRAIEKGDRRNRSR